MTRDPFSELKVISLIHAQTATSTVTGTAVDLGPDYTNQNFLAILDVGAAADTGATLAVTIKGSSTSGGSYTTLTTFTTVADTDDNKIAAGRVARTSPIDGTYRYLKAVGTIAGGSSPSFTFSVVLLAQVNIAKETLNSLAVA